MGVGWGVGSAVGRCGAVRFGVVVFVLATVVVVVVVEVAVWGDGVAMGW